MKQTIQLLCFVLCSFSTFAAADNTGQYWNKANAAYKQKQYDSAIFYYTEIIVLQPGNAIVYYNLGNAYYKSNRVSEAVLNYERALFYNTSLNDARDNLVLTRSRIPNSLKQYKDIFFIRWWSQLTAGNTAATWAILSLCLFLGLLGMALSNIIKKNKKIPGQVFVLTPLLLLFFLFCAFTAAQNATKTNKAVVMTNTAVMTAAPNMYKGQIAIPEATTVKTGREEGSWIAITLPDHREGWIQKSALTFVLVTRKK